MSSGEVEYYVALKGASNALEYQSMLKDIGLHASGTLYSDSSAARGIIHRAGSGKATPLGNWIPLGPVGCSEETVASKWTRESSCLVYQVFG